VPTIRLRSLILFFIWFSVSLCYYGVTYYIPNLYGDKYLNFILSGGIELAAYLLAFVVLGRVGNKNPPKKPTQKTLKNPPKKPTKNGFFGFFWVLLNFLFFMKIIQTFIFDTVFLGTNKT
jgi:hypothetical protein